MTAENKQIEGELQNLGSATEKAHRPITVVFNVLKTMSSSLLEILAKQEANANI